MKCLEKKFSVSHDTAYRLIREHINQKGKNTKSLLILYKDMTLRNEELGYEKTFQYATT